MIKWEKNGKKKITRIKKGTQLSFVMVELPEVTSPEAALIGSDRK
jgi:hypothetical protein